MGTPTNFSIETVPPKLGNNTGERIVGTRGEQSAKPNTITSALKIQIIEENLGSKKS